MTTEPRTETVELPAGVVRDVWAKENLTASGTIEVELVPHGARILRVTPA